MNDRAERSRLMIERRAGLTVREGDRGRPLKICLASVAPFVGGAEVAAERLALGLQGEGHDVLMVLGRRNEVLKRMRRAGLRCEYCPLELRDKRHPVRTIGSRARLWNLIRREKPDLVHANDLPTHQVVSDISRFTGVPTVCHHRFPFDGRTVDWMNKFGADLHILVSRFMMDEMTQASPRLAEAPRLVIHDGLELPPRPREDDRIQARRALGLTEDKVLVLFAGQVIPIKGVADLIDAFALLDAASRARCELLIVGDDHQHNGAYRREMEALCRGLGCAARFPGFVSDLPRWMTAADMVVAPSHVEPLGNVILETMSLARAVIGSDVGGIPEMVVHGETGLLVPPRSPRALADAIEALIRDPELRNRMGDRGRLRCEANFSIGTHVRAMLCAYDQVLQEPRSKHSVTLQ
jgi:glycosyltransferase involved in cell wall biosynthesis